MAVALFVEISSFSDQIWFKRRISESVIFSFREKSNECIGIAEVPGPEAMYKVQFY
jgi:hypothetical protein